MPITRTTLALPPQVSAEITAEVTSGSAIARASKLIPIPGVGTLTRKIGEIEARWQGAEASRKHVTQNVITEKQIDPYTVAVIVPVAKQFAEDAPAVFQAVKESAPRALYTALDQSAFGQLAVPGANFDSLGGAQTVNALDYDTLLSAFEAATDNGGTPSHFIVGNSVLWKLRRLVDANGRPLLDPSATELFGVPILKSTGLTDTAFLGDFAERSVWGSVNGIEVSVSEEGTITDPNTGTLVSLWETNQIGIRVEARFAFRVNDLADFVQVTSNAPVAAG